MKKYIFITPEGNTTSPNGDEIENMQVIGIVEEVTNEVTELSDITPISFNPENTNEVEHFQYASKRPRSIMDSILEKISK
jgi:hypothetical protein